MRPVWEGWNVDEFYANGHDAGYAGDAADSHDLAPGTAAHTSWVKGWEDGRQAAWMEYEREYPPLEL